MPVIFVEESNSYPQNNIIHDKSYMINHNKVSSRMHPKYGEDSNLKEPSPHHSTYIIGIIDDLLSCDFVPPNRERESLTISGLT